MIRILLVDDNDDFRGSIRRTLPPPAYDVDDVKTFGEALSRLRAGSPYDVAIVDLNLTEYGSDRLGEDLLEILEKEYPLIVRVALTGETPSSVREFLEQFKVADLLLKHQLQLGDVRRVVRRVLAGTGREIPLQLRSDRGEQWGQLRKWRDERTQPFKDRAELLDNDLRALDPASARGRAVAGELAGLQAERAALEKACSAVAVKLANVRTEADLAAATVDLIELRDRYQSSP
jgi:CheY-like chemotaxis protein